MGFWSKSPFSSQLQPSFNLLDCRVDTILRAHALSKAPICKTAWSICAMTSSPSMTLNAAPLHDSMLSSESSKLRTIDCKQFLPGHCIQAGTFCICSKPISQTLLKQHLHRWNMLVLLSCDHLPQVGPSPEGCQL